jgi:hypothetical protein
MEKSKYIDLPILRGITEIRDILRIITANNSVICGGYARYCCSPRQEPVPAQDVDVFPRTDDAYEKNKIAFLALGYTIAHENQNALSLANPKDGLYAFTPHIQIIKPVKEGAILTVGTLEEILDNFDFTITRVGIINENFVKADEEFIEHEKHRLLILKNIHCPVSSMLRAMKYSRKGYFLRPNQAIKLFLDWDARTPEYRIRLIELFKTSALSTEEQPMSQKEIDELEALLNID